MSANAMHFLSGVAAGISSQIVCHPLDVIRTAYQAEVATTTASSISGIVMGLGKQGFGSFYKGLLPPLMGQGLYKGIIFSVNSFCNQSLLPHFEFGVHTNIFLSGTIAGTANSFVVAPIELVRTRLIIHPEKGLSATKVIGELVGNGGITGLWRGVLPTCLRDGPGLGFYFLAFHQAKQQLSSFSVERDGSLSFQQRVFAASLAGAAFWVYALPVDTLKTLIEAAPSGTVSSLGSVLGLLSQSKGGIKRMINAYPLALVRGVPASVVTLLTFDHVLSLLTATSQG